MSACLIGLTHGEVPVVQMDGHDCKLYSHTPCAL